LIFFGSSKSDRINELISNDTNDQFLAMCSSNLMRLSKEKYEYFLIYYFSWIDFIINSLVPFVIIVIANTNVMYSVCQSHIIMKELGVRQTRSARDAQLAYILFVSTFLFLVLTFPLRVFSAIEPYLNYEKEYLVLLDGIMRFLLYLDHGCGFYLYTFTGELFRRELRKFIYECLLKLFRRRYFNWTYVESRRQSELSCSNGGSHIYHPSQQANIPLRDSISSCTGAGGMNTGMKVSLHSLQAHKTHQNIFHHQCIYAKLPLTNTLSTSSSRTKLNLSIGKSNSLISEQTYGLVKRHSSSCFESQYTPITILCPSDNLLPTIDLDRKSDIV
jgi:hypothetical protein